MKYNLYPAEVFGIRGTPDIDESYAVMIRLDERGIETSEAYAVYIVNDNYYMPPNADMASAQPVDVSDRPPGLMPTLHNVDIDEEGRMIINIPGRTWEMTPEQEDLLVMPLCLNTDHGEYWLSGQHERVMVRDESLSSVPAIRLDSKEFYRTMNEKYPALLERTHTFYGNRFPIFPSAKYYEGQDKTVVFIAASQLKYVSQSVLDGTEAFYRDRETGDEWNVKNTYGVCVIDDVSSKDRYEAKLISPYQLDLYIEQMERGDGFVREERKKEPSNEDGLGIER